LTKIKSNSFQHLKNLKKLDLYDNKINEKDSHGFQGLENLEELDLRSTGRPRIWYQALPMFFLFFFRW